MCVRNIKLLLILATFFSLLLAMTGVEAKKPGDGKPGDDYVRTNFSNWAMWDSDYIWDVDEFGARLEEPPFCGGDDEVVRRPNPQGALVYTCHSDHSYDNKIAIDLSALGTGEGGLEATGPESDLCAHFLQRESPFFMNLDADSIMTFYHYSMDPTWNDGPCVWDNKSNSCYLKITASAYFEYGDVACTPDFSKCGRLVRLEGWGHVKPYGDPLDDPPFQLNPFGDPQEISIEELTVFFKGIRKNRTVATCFFDNFDEETEEYSEDIVFITRHY